jgi:hypothetical protein
LKSIHTLNGDFYGPARDFTGRVDSDNLLESIT